MILFRDLIGGLGVLLLAPLITWAAQPVPPEGPSTGPGGEVRRPPDRVVPPHFVILKSPEDLPALLQKLLRPDMEIRQIERPTAEGAGNEPRGERPTSVPWVVESVRARGRIADDFAVLTIEMVITLATNGPTWVPIYLDDQKLSGAREGDRELVLQTSGQSSSWQVELTGRGRHRIEVELRAPVMSKPARKALSLAIPPAASTSVDLEFPHHQSDIIVPFKGTNEVFPQVGGPGDKGTRLTAQLTPRSRLDLSWSDDADADGHGPPLLTTQGEIAIDIDPEQMSTRSSWTIRCVRGMTRTLEVRVDARDEVTDMRLDDQPMEVGGVEAVRGARRLMLRLPGPLRPDAPPRHLVMKTRRSLTKAATRRIAFEGFPLINAHDQSGAIGVTLSPNLWVSPAMSQELRRMEPGELPIDLRERPSTRLAFAFLDQPFLLQLDVEASPPLVRARSRTLFQIDAGAAHSEATIDLQWARGRPFEVELGVGPGLQVLSVGPSNIVEGWSLSGGPVAGNSKGSGEEQRTLKIGLTSLARDQMKVGLTLEGYQQVPRDGPVKLGVFAPEASTSVPASYALVADRGLSVELDDDSGQVTRAGDLASGAKALFPDRPAASPGSGTDAPPLLLTGSAGIRSLPVRIARHARSLAQRTVLSAEVSRRSVDLLQETTFTVRHGTLSSLDVRVPASIGDHWELVERAVVDRKELGQGPDGTRGYRLSFDRPVLDQAALRFRCHLPIAPRLDAAGPRDVVVPWITFDGAAAGLVRLELSTAPGVLLHGNDPARAPAGAEGPANRPGQSPALVFNEGPDQRGRPFVFKALALEPVEMPPLVVPRLLVRSVQALDGTVRSLARYWVETHGPAFSFAMPAGARWLAARVNGRTTDQVDHDPTRSGYRLRLPADAAAGPAVVELEYQLDGPVPKGRWQAPRLLDGGVVLETLWEAQLPWDQAVVGVPQGWSDENQWSWTGKIWKRGPSKTGPALARWLGDIAPESAIDDPRDVRPDDSHRLLFSRVGEPSGLAVWVVPRAWIIAACSGIALGLGFLAIFARVRFRTVWSVVAVFAVLAAVLVPPSVMFLGLQSAFMGVALSLLGLLIQRLLDHAKPSSPPSREPVPAAGSALGGSSLDRRETIGSDDSTAIRARVPSTMDFVPSPIIEPAADGPARSSTLERA